MDLLDLTILALRIALVAVLYGFLVLVVRLAGRWLQTGQPVPPASSDSPSRPGVRLVVTEAGGSGLSVGQLIEVWDGLTLGRAERGDVVLADTSVSAEHARVSRVGRDWVVRDLGSTNGTLVNGAPVHGQTRLRHGDVLALGGVHFEVVLR